MWEVLQSILVALAPPPTSFEAVVRQALVPHLLIVEKECQIVEKEFRILEKELGLL